MQRIANPHILAALAIAVATAIAAGLLGGQPQIVLIVLIGAVAAALLAARKPEPLVLSPTPAPDTTPTVAAVLEGISEPVLLIERNRVSAANEAARTLLGAHILDEDVRVAIRHPAAAQRLMADDEKEAGPIHLVGLGTRDQRWEMHVHPLDGDQRLVHLIDRTGSHAAEKMRVDFVANASHELRTPLASLLGFIETLRDGAGEDAETRERFLKIMHGEAQRMQRLIDDLISLSRIEAEKFRAPNEAVDLGALVREVCGVLGEEGGERARDLRVEIAPTTPVRGDRAQLSQLLHNVIGNALKYGRSGTPVAVTLAPEGEMTRLSVADKGDGIAPQHLPRLTERFYRVDAGRSHAVGGTGLGLSIVRHIVERHRGRLDIASVVGTGTTVTILLPARKLS
ncbi:ATP-binding protein [Sphingomonas soli]|uniref:ATP-binding protein n=1 Tax=Sphingomonas soli TaxID=266127 RepID=UPI00082DD293|nr:ATP-binding protein [Sphingomonas soli]